MRSAARAGSRLLTATEVAEMTGWTVATIQKKAREGALPSRKLGRLTRFVPAEIEQWLAELPRPS